MTIGLHGMGHVDWRTLTEAGLLREISDARTAIETCTQKAVTKAAVPFGRYNRHVLNALKRSGVDQVYTSDRGVRLLTGSVQPRLSVRSGMLAREIEASIEKSYGLWQRSTVELKLLVKRSL